MAKFLEGFSVSQDMSLSAMVDARLREYKWKLVVWTLFALPLWLLMLFNLVWNTTTISSNEEIYSKIFYTVLVIGMNLGAFAMKPKALFEQQKEGQK